MQRWSYVQAVESKDLNKLYFVRFLNSLCKLILIELIKFNRSTIKLYSNNTEL